MRVAGTAPRARRVAAPGGGPARPGAALARGAALRAVVHTRYGGPEAVEIRDIDRPEPGDDGVLVRVRAASLNRYDWYALTGVPAAARVTMGVRGPKEQALGGDFAGVVEAVGKD